MSQQSYPIGVWNDLLTAEHKAKMGVALWYLCWLVDKVTDQYEDGGQVHGKVLGGSVIKSEQIARALGDSEATVRKHLHLLEVGGYIKRRQHREGFIIEVLYAKRRFRDFLCSDPSPSSDCESTRVEDLKSSRLEQNVQSRDLQVFRPREPSIKDIAVREDITKSLPADEEEHAPEADRIWQAAVAAVGPQTTPGAVEILLRCRSHGVDRNFVYVDWTALAEEERERARRHQLMLTQAAGREIRFGIPQTNEARAGPERGESHADAAASP